MKNNNGARYDRLVKENQALKEKVKHYESLAARALTDYQNKSIIEERKHKSILEMRKLESQTKSIAQKMRREEEKQRTFKGQIAVVSDKLIGRWKDMFTSSDS